jgi:hypothetical protein
MPERLISEPIKPLIVVVGKDDVIILKTIAPPAMSEFDLLVSVARKQAQKAKLTPAFFTV